MNITVDHGARGVDAIAPLQPNVLQGEATNANAVGGGAVSRVVGIIEVTTGCGGEVDLMAAAAGATAGFDFRHGCFGFVCCAQNTVIVWVVSFFGFAFLCAFDYTL